MPSESDILKQSFYGHLQVTIEKVGTFGVDAIGEPLCMLAAEVETFLGAESEGAVSKEDHPYELVSFDQRQAKLVVRKKK